jgi:hypothetical protein
MPASSFQPDTSTETMEAQQPYQTSGTTKCSLCAKPSSTAASRISYLLHRLTFSSSPGDSGGVDERDISSVPCGGGDEWDISFVPSGGGGGGDWASTWSTGLTKDHFDGSSPPVGRPVPPPSDSLSNKLAAVRAMDAEEELMRDLERDNLESKAYVDSWDDRMTETCALLR